MAVRGTGQPMRRDSFIVLVPPADSLAPHTRVLRHRLPFTAGIHSRRRGNATVGFVGPCPRGRGTGGHRVFARNRSRYSGIGERWPYPAVVRVGVDPPPVRHRLSRFVTSCFHGWVEGHRWSFGVDEIDAVERPVGRIISCVESAHPNEKKWRSWGRVSTNDMLGVHISRMRRVASCTCVLPRGVVVPEEQGRGSYCVPTRNNVSFRETSVTILPIEGRNQSIRLVNRLTSLTA